MAMSIIRTVFKLHTNTYIYKYKSYQHIHFKLQTRDKGEAMGHCPPPLPDFKNATSY